MSLIIFNNNKGENFELGTVSMNWLDKHDIFDAYQEDENINSEIIFKTSKKNVEQLSKDIFNCAQLDERLRPDIKEKLENFSKFVCESDGLICNIA